MTNSTDCVGSFIDDSRLYLSWDEMEWKQYGKVRAFNVSQKELCEPKNIVTTTFLPGMKNIKAEFSDLKILEYS